MPLRTAGLVCLPINHEGLQVIALSCQSLPAIGATSWPDHIKMMLCLGGDQEVGIDIAAVEHVCPGQEIPIRQVLLNGGAHDAIWRGSRRRHHLRDKIRVVGIAGLGEMELIAHQGVSRLLL